MKGIIDKIWENKTKGNKPYWVLSINGDNYSVWDKKYLEGIQEGSSVEYEWRPSGDYRKVTDLKKIEMEPGFERAGKSNGRDQQIIRMSCVKSAVVLASNSDKLPKDKAEMTLGIARQFEKYVTDKEDEAPDQKKGTNEKEPRQEG